MTSSVSEIPRATAGTNTTPVFSYALSAEEAAQALALAEQCLARYGSAEDPAFVRDAPVIAAELPRGLREAVNRARLDDRLHALVITGNRVDGGALEPTPMHWRVADTPGSRVHGILLALYAVLLGDLIAWATQQDGRLVTDVLPIPGYEDSLVSSCSEQELGWHTEDAFSPSRADYVGLYCLSAPERIPTTVAGVDLAQVPDAVARVLVQPRFIILPDSSHDPANNTDQGQGNADAFERLAERLKDPQRVAVLAGHPQAPVLRLDRDFTIAQDDDAEAADALRWIIAHLDGQLYELVLDPGDVGFVDNRNVVHGRRSFRPRYDGQDRWLKRVNVVGDLRRTRPDRADAGTRVIG
ncbi:Fe(II)/alpha-ketoglutarate-dependent arginine beta-hydroxylase [Kitasatospora sp. MAA4]|uniref:arginine beta-hydroxylase, Fe(II)/alpha-ketoglutarate-dependent n=1 Tax=Kitasatospora sp. MAA4 TaxID=3035093 RepID=UPI0024755022|nr:arginine beta-hydroxylase, Fe(II)/alpha-ketoglutarate-dependent [Kitasatospora sp. MAA4]MDH6136215.1 Fe(II)/alpha-ketoglutarate-dependent arginine beta-hydroxylase [Kitasatospora sp. MAA4]